jgi:hypothetical protein
VAGCAGAGIDVRVFERDEVRTDGLHGYRVGIDPDGSRALHALHALLPADLYDVFVATCARAPRYFCSADGDLLVAANGTRSRVRRQYLPQARLVDTGVLCGQLLMSATGTANWSRLSAGTRSECASTRTQR